VGNSFLLQIPSLNNVRGGFFRQFSPERKKGKGVLADERSPHSKGGNHNPKILQRRGERVGGNHRLDPGRRGEKSTAILVEVEMSRAEEGKRAASPRSRRTGKKKGDVLHIGYQRAGRGVKGRKLRQKEKGGRGAPRLNDEERTKRMCA